MTSDARATELIRDHFSKEWPRICPDATYSVSGSPSPQDEVHVHLEVWSGLRRAKLSHGRVGWIYLRCWVPLGFQISGTMVLHQAAREVFEGALIPSDDGGLSVDQGERADIGRDCHWWMSVMSFPFSFVSGR